MDSIDRLKKAVSLSGCSVRIVQTGDQRYKRGFISKDNCVFGRAVIFNNVFSHIKWYCPIDDMFKYLENNKHRIYINSAIESFIGHGVEISIEEVIWLIDKSIELNLKDKNKKELARLSMSNKKRRSVKGKSAASFFKDALSELIKIKEGK